jgi:NADP-reducing hydrogenase subunit HndD
VFDTDFAADLTILEEGNELIERMKNGGSCPIITSCSPGWVKFCEHYLSRFPRESLHLQVSAADDRRVIKTTGTREKGIDPEKDRCRFGHALHREEV